MTTAYRFKFGYTKLGEAANPSPAPTVNVRDIATDTLLVTGGALVQSAVMPGAFTYTYNGAAGLDLMTLAHTTDASMDERDIFGIDIDAAVVLSGALSSTSVAYATLAEFKMYSTVRGGTDKADANDDTVIEDILKLASNYIDGQTGRRFYQNAVDETRYYTPLVHDRVFIDDLAAAPTSVKSDTGGDRTYATTLGATDYDLEPDNALLHNMPYTYLEIAPDSSEYFATVRKGVQIVGKFGFPSLPDDIKGACLGIALNVYQNRSGQSSQGNVTVTAAGVVIRPQDVSPLAQKAIEKYRKLF